MENETIKYWVTGTVAVVTLIIFVCGFVAEGWKAFKEWVTAVFLVLLLPGLMYVILPPSSLGWIYFLIAWFFWAFFMFRVLEGIPEEAAERRLVYLMRELLRIGKERQKRGD
jgi:hypothetical protein